MLDDLSLQVQSIYDGIGKNKHLSISSGCVCPNSTPMATVLEMLPAALELSTGQNLKAVLSMLQKRPPRCLFFYEGNCQSQSTRPSPCIFPEGKEDQLEALREKLRQISPSWSENNYPINQALFLALEKILNLSGMNGRGPGAS